jgi:type I restriction enzyme M protein
VVIYLPDNLFYNTSAPGVILILSRAKPKTRAGRVFMVNASARFEKGDPKNYLGDDDIADIVNAFIEWAEADNFARPVTSAEIVEADYNLSPTRYIQGEVVVAHRPIGEIVSDLRSLEASAREVDAELSRRLTELGL